MDKETSKKNSRATSTSSGASDVMAGYKTIFSNKSEVVCVIGNTLGISAWNFYLIYGASFWRQRYHVSTDFISVAIIFRARA